MREGAEEGEGETGSCRRQVEEVEGVLHSIWQRKLRLLEARMVELREVGMIGDLEEVPTGKKVSAACGEQDRMQMHLAT